MNTASHHGTSRLDATLRNASHHTTRLSASHHPAPPYDSTQRIRLLRRTAAQLDALHRCATHHARPRCATHHNATRRIATRHNATQG